MDVLSRLDTPIYPPVDDAELVTKKYVDDKTADVPSVARVRVLNRIDTGTASMNLWSVELQLDNPAPANCFVQFWRSTNQRRGNSGRHTKAIGFRPAGHDATLHGVVPGNTGGFPVVAVGQGARSISCGSIPALFRPSLVKGAAQSSNFPIGGYSRYYREVPQAQWNNDLPVWMRNYYSVRRRDVKCILKFGLILRYREPVTNFWIEKRGPMSAETVRIERWRYNWNATTPASWGYHVTMD